MLISVVVATYNRRECLLSNLNQLQEQTFKDFEVVVADDGSSDGTVEAVQKQAETVGYPLQVVTQPKIGYRLARSRNNGVSMAKGEWLVFLDDDCLPNPQWLECYAASCSTNAVLKGDTLFVRSYAKPYPPLTIYRGSNRGLHGTNFAVPRVLFVSVGGFDEEYVNQAGEDTDLGQRLELAGIPFIRVEGAHVFHLGLPTGGGGLPNDLYRHNKIFDRTIVRNVGVDPFAQT